VKTSVGVATDGKGDGVALDVAGEDPGVDVEPEMTVGEGDREDEAGAAPLQPAMATVASIEATQTAAFGDPGSRRGLST
jgi:hypothetical protein